MTKEEVQKLKEELMKKADEEARMKFIKFSEWLEGKVNDGTPMAASNKVGVSHDDKAPKGVRNHKDDLSNDYSGHDSFHGDIGPYKLKGKNMGKPVADVGGGGGKGKGGKGKGKGPQGTGNKKP